MRAPDDDDAQDRLDAAGRAHFRWRSCPRCGTEMPTDEQVPPYSWVHDVGTGEHRSRPGQRHPPAGP